jgi:putative ABC transport system substrate-binding protein
MRRREFIGLLGGAAAWPITARAQQSALPVVGFLNSASADRYASMAAAFGQGLREAGYVDGANVIIEHRWAEDQYDRLPLLAADLVNRRVALIFANSPAIPHAKAATSTTPIVFMMGDDPVRLGYVASFNRPGGNITGVTILSGELAAKRLRLLRDLIPQAKLVDVLVNLDFGPTGRFQAEIEAAAATMGQPVRFLSARSSSEIDNAFAALAQAHADALLVGPGPFLDSRREQLVALAAKFVTPAAYENRTTAIAGGLMSYGASVEDGYRRAGIYAGRILKGEKPSELPVFQVTKFELVLNLKTARALNLKVSNDLLSVADEVIE